MRTIPIVVNFILIFNVAFSHAKPNKKFGLKCTLEMNSEHIGNTVKEHFLIIDEDNSKIYNQDMKEMGIGGTTLINSESIELKQSDVEKSLEWKINRNSGQIKLLLIMNGRVLSQGSGPCEKWDYSKKKF